AMPKPLALLFLVAFGAGTVLSMALFSALAGHTLRVATARSLAGLRAVSVGAGTASIVVGMWWAATGGA
ncbi:MAG: hypothetical protein JO180_03855, partial [Gemmatirosa sp.]|nr:hypothetical protein [Gemmatirosa sp.]